MEKNIINKKDIYSLYNLKFFKIINVDDKIINKFKNDNNIYNNKNLEKVINKFTMGGKKFLGEKNFLNLINFLKNEKKKNGYKILLKSIKFLKPSIDLKKYRKRGMTIDKPYKIKDRRKLYLALKWLIKIFKEKNKKDFIKKLSEELITIKKGVSIKLKKEMYRKGMYGRVHLRIRSKKKRKEKKNKYKLDIKKSLMEIEGNQVKQVIKK